MITPTPTSQRRRSCSHRWAWVHNDCATTPIESSGGGFTHTKETESLVHPRGSGLFPGRLEPMNFENLILEKKNAIAYVTVNRPKVLNALNMATMEELRAAFHDIKNDP